MERALLIAKPDALDSVEEEYDRLYFGCEFCERLIPKEARVERALAVAGERNMAFTLVTPYVTDKGADRLKELLPWLAERAPDAEVVVNDWGMLHFIASSGLPFKLALGRLLTKQKRGPRLMRLVGKLPAKAFEHFKRSNVDVPALKDFVLSKGVVRFELDNLPQGIVRDPSVPASLYYPYVYVSTTRLCLSSACEHRTTSLREIAPCGQECQRFTFHLNHKDMPVELLLRGNTQFYVNDQLPENLDPLGVDRLVYEPDLPL